MAASDRGKVVERGSRAAADFSPTAPTAQSRSPLAAQARVPVLASRHKLHSVSTNKPLKTRGWEGGSPAA